LGKSVQIPGEDATVDERNEVLRKLGYSIPSSPEEYAIERPETLPPGFVYNEALEGKMRQLAHSVGVSQEQLAALMKGYNEFRIQNHENLVKTGNEQLQQVWNKMRNDWGADFDANRQMSLKAVKQFGGDGLLQYFQANPEVGNNPLVIAAFYKIGKAMSEGTAPTGGEPGGQPEDQSGGGFRLQYNTPMGPEKDRGR
jgi:hypothetical protein